MQKGFAFVVLLSTLGLVIAGCSGLGGLLGGSGSIKGKVTDKATGAPVEGAKITTNPATEEAKTASDGTYLILEVEPGRYAVAASKDGYNPASKSISVEAGVTADANIELTLIIWTTKAPMPTGRSELAVGAVNNKIYAIGGCCSGGNALTTVEEYDPATNQWTTKAPMPTGRSGLAVGVVNNKIYAIGGAAGLTGNLTTVEEYDPATNQWTMKAEMPTGRWGLAVGVVNNKIYAIGGGGLTTVEEYDPAKDQ